MRRNFAFLVIAVAILTPDLLLAAEPLGPWLNCLNRIEPPIARALNLQVRDIAKPQAAPSAETALFYADGFYVIAPEQGWYAAQPPLSRPRDAAPGYNLFVRKPDGTVAYFRYYLDLMGPGDVATGPGARGAWMGNETFTQIGRPNERIDHRRAITATRTEIIKRMKTIAASTHSYTQFMTQEHGEDSSSVLTQVKQVLCECGRLIDPAIDAEAKSIIRELKIDDAQICFNPVSP